MYINGINILHFESVDSTNKVALNLEDWSHLLTIVADNQECGRGRLGRSFFSYDGGLYMSVIIDPQKISVPFHICTPAAALAVVNCLEKYGLENAQIKWVNDVLVNGKKICGILTESRSESGEIDRLVVGIGINLENTKITFPDEIKEKADFAKCKVDKLTLASDIACALGELLLKEQSKIVEEYSANLAWEGQNAMVTDYSQNNKQINGKIVGVTNDCFLRLELPDKSIITLSSGEII